MICLFFIDPLTFYFGGGNFVDATTNHFIVRGLLFSLAGKEQLHAQQTVATPFSMML